MHRMHSNRVTNRGTSALEDDSIRRIQTGVENVNERRSAKHRKTSSMKKTAKVSNDDADNNTKRIIIASLDEIPSDFERIGTGFFRQGHHLWEISPGENGFVLNRKHGEDHVLGYDPDPIKKESSISVIDRFGRELKKGVKVRLPLHGKVATGTIIVVTPGALDIGLEQGGMTTCPPGMVEYMGEGEIEEEGDKDAGSVFEPEIGEKPESDYVGPQSSQSGEIGGPGIAAEAEAEEEEEECLATKTAQTDEPGQTTTMEPAAPGAPAEDSGLPTFEPSEKPISDLQKELDQNNVAAIYSMETGKNYLIYRRGDKYDVRMETFESLGLWDETEFARFEESLGTYEIQPTSPTVATMLKHAFNVVSNFNDEVKDWKDYWKSVGQRVAKAPPKPPKPRLSEDEKKQRRTERRKQRDIERAGLPKGTKLPPKPKVGVKDSDERAQLKEIINIYEQGVDELEYVINNIDPEEPNADVIAMDAVTDFLQNVSEAKEGLEEDSEQEREDELSLETPSDMELGIQTRKSERVVVSMSDL